MKPKRRKRRSTREAFTDALVLFNTLQASDAEAPVPPPQPIDRGRWYRHRQKMSRLRDEIIERLKKR